MADASLQIIIDDPGASPVGRPAPDPVREQARAQSERPAAAQSGPGRQDAPPFSIREAAETIARAAASFEQSVGDFARLVAARSVAPDTTRPASETHRPRQRGPVEDAPQTVGGAIGAAFRDISGTLGLTGLLNVTRMVIDAFRDLASATRQTATEAVQEQARRSRQIDMRVVDVTSRPVGPGIPAGQPTPHITTTALSTRVGPQNPPGPAGAGGGPVGFPQFPGVQPIQPAAQGVQPIQPAAQATGSMLRLAVTVAAVTAAVAALGVAARMAGNALDAQARHLSQYSGPLSASTAQADIRRMMSEMERARSVGPGLARFQSDWSRAMNSFYQLGTTMLELLMKLYELFRPFVDAVQIVLDVIAAALEVLVDLVKIIVDVLTVSPKELLKDLGELKDDIVKWLKKMAARNDTDDLEDEFAKELLAPVGGLVMPGEGGKPAAPGPFGGAPAGAARGGQGGRGFGWQGGFGGQGAF